MPEHIHGHFPNFIDLDEIRRTVKPLAQASIPLSPAVSNMLNRWKTTKGINNMREAAPNMKNVPSQTTKK